LDAPRRRDIQVTFVLPIVAILVALADPATPTPLDAGFHQMYDLQFDEAHRTFHQWTEQHPEDPMGPACDAAAYLFSELDRLHILQSEFFLHDDEFVNRTKPAADQKLKQDFDRALARTQELADRAIARDPHDQNARFAALMRFGLRSDYVALIEKRYIASLADVKQSRDIAERLVAADPNFGDAYLAIGVENYLLSLKPAPLRWFLRLDGAETDKQRGLQNLTLTAERGRYLQPYARILLAVAALRDKNVPRAKELLSGLARQFPRNPLYLREIARLK
jgi:hypothetical protein